MEINTQLLFDDTVSFTQAVRSIDNLKFAEQYAPSLNILPRPLEVSLGAIANSHINIDSISIPRLTSDIAVIVTKRLLVQTPDVTTRGTVRSKFMDSSERNIGFALHANRAAIIDIEIADRPGETMAHEIGHLIGVQAFSDGVLGIHCDQDICIMAAYNDPTIEQSSFCEDCSDEMLVKSEQLAMKLSRR